MQALGRMSYAWYIWHWPVLVFAAAVLGPLSVAGALAAVALSLVPTVLTHRWVEEPVRRSRRRPRLALAAAPVAAALVVGLGSALAAVQPHIRIDELCAGALCPAVIGNVLVYRQSGHLTATYAATMTPWFDRHLSRA